jgi:hypothetical protein
LAARHAGLIGTEPFAVNVSTLRTHITQSR